MSNGITKENLVFTAPSVLVNDETMNPLVNILAEALEKLAGKLSFPTIYSRIDTLSEEMLDILARDFKVDWYDFDLNIEEKRAVIKNSFYIHRHLGTKASIEAALKNIWPKTTVEEWFDYGGNPYYFRLEVEIPETGINPQQLRAASNGIIYYKNVRSHLDGINYTHHSNCAIYAGAYTGVSTQIEVWPQLVNKMESVKPVGSTGYMGSQNCLDVWPETISRAEFSTQIEFGSTFITDSQLEIYP